MQNSIVNGRYQLIQQIGAGGFGLTFLAEDVAQNGRPRCVVKYLNPPAADPESWRLAHHLFQQEAETLYRLGGHPNIPNLVAHFEENGHFFLVQEFIEGHTIEQEVRFGRRYNQHETIQFLGETLEILAFVHREKVIHGDVKPANLIRRNADGRLFLIDFGAVKLAPRKPRSSEPDAFAHVAVGSHGYMPLEQLTGAPNFSSDLYALGLVAIEAMTGFKPFDLAKDAATGEFVWPPQARLAPEVEAFLARLVRVDPRQRFFTAGEALTALGQIAKNVGYFNRPAPKGVVTVPPLGRPPLPPMPPPHLIPPTIIVPVAEARPQYHAPVPARARQNGPRLDAAALREQAAGDRKLQRVALIFGGLAALMVGFYAVDRLTRPSVERPQVVRVEQAQLDRARTDALRPAPTASRPTLDVYREAVAQADEAAAKESKATTRYEWQEIGNQYRRAYLLLDTLEATHPKYDEARAKIGIFKRKSEAALEKSQTAPERP